MIATLKPQDNGPSYTNTVIGTLAVDGWAVTFGTARRGLLAVPNETARASTARTFTVFVFEIWIWRRMMKVLWTEHKTNEKILQMVET